MPTTFSKQHLMARSSRIKNFNFARRNNNFVNTALLICLIYCNACAFFNTPVQLVGYKKKKKNTFQICYIIPRRDLSFLKARVVRTYGLPSRLFGSLLMWHTQFLARNHSMTLEYCYSLIPIFIIFYVRICIIEWLEFLLFFTRLGLRFLYVFLVLTTRLSSI